MEVMKLYRTAACFLLLTCAATRALAQTNPCRTTQPVSTLGSPPVPQAPIVYDPNQSVCWLANADLAGDPAMRTALGSHRNLPQRFDGLRHRAKMGRGSERL